MALLSVGVDHEHATLDFLERVTLPEHEWPKVLRTLISHRNIHEAVLVSTCLRTEVVAVIDRFHGAVDEISQTLADATALPVEEFQDRLSVNFERGVVKHLFEVAGGLKSVVPGEYEVLGQVRRSLELALEEQTAGRELEDLFRRALATGRRVRAETSISRGTTSFAQAATTFAFESLDSPGDLDVAVIGSGQLATGVVRSLLARPGYVRRLTLINRTPARAEAAALDVDDARVDLANWEDLADVLARVRVVVSAVEVPSPIVTRDVLEGTSSPLLVVDLGMPRSVSSDVEELVHVRLIDIGDLSERVERVLGVRHEARDEAEAIVLDDLERYVADQRARGAAGIVRELREHFDEVVDQELARRARDIEGFSAEERELIRSLVRSVVAKIAHRPTVVLKEAAGTDDGARLSETARTLFDL